MALSAHTDNRSNSLNDSSDRPLPQMFADIFADDEPPPPPSPPKKHKEIKKQPNDPNFAQQNRGIDPRMFAAPQTAASKAGNPTESCHKVDPVIIRDELYYHKHVIEGCELLSPLEAGAHA